MVEVDASTIKGMLNNLDITLSVAVNHWIIGTLFFHFILVHVSVTKHGPDGLSQKPPQERDPPPLKDGMNDFLHTHYGLLQTQTSQIHSIFLITVEDTESLQELNISLIYKDMLCTTQQVLCDKRLEYVLKWHTKLEQPPGYNKKDCKIYMLHNDFFFEKNDKLWHKNLQEKH